LKKWELRARLIFDAFAQLTHVTPKSANFGLEWKQALELLDPA